jgi:hypothetical protein
VLAWLPYAAIALIALAVGVSLFRTRDDDPTWTERWKSLSPTARRRITTSVRTGALLADPEEIEVAAELARRRHAMRIFTDVWAFIVAGLGTALVIAGLVANLLFLVIFGGFFLIGGVWVFRSESSLREIMYRGRGD